MFFLYSIILTVAFVVLLPRFVYDAVTKGKYASGFRERLGSLPRFDAAGQPVVWVHCVSVGETNAARPLIDAIRREYPDISIVISTTTSTGQTLAKQLFSGTADLVFYFPFDWRWTVRRSLRRIKPSAVLLMETEIWFNFIREAHKNKAFVAIVNGRLSEKSLKRFGLIRNFMHRVLSHIDIALMQDKADAQRLMSLGMRANKVKVTGNVKFDMNVVRAENYLTEEIRSRFGITDGEPLIIAASTHEPEERWVLEAFKTVWKASASELPRLMLVPRHPERFAAVADEIRRSGFTWVRRSENVSERDKTAEVILLDSIGELRQAYPLAEVVFVGGSLIPHGGQSVIEPAAEGKAIITGPYTANFSAAIKELSANHALIQLSEVPGDEIATKLAEAFAELLNDRERRSALGRNAEAVIDNNRGAVTRTLEYLKPFLNTVKGR